MDELIFLLYDITKKMTGVLAEKDFEGFSRLLDERDELMCKVDTLKSMDPTIKYSQKAKLKLEETMRLDQEMLPLLNMEYMDAKSLLEDTRRKKQVSKNYQMILKQTNGAFVDTKK